MEFREDLFRLAAADAQFFAGYMISWLVANLDVDQLGHLVDELDDTIRVDGQRVLDRPANRRRDL